MCEHLSPKKRGIKKVVPHPIPDLCVLLVPSSPIPCSSVMRESAVLTSCLLRFRVLHLPYEMGWLGMSATAGWKAFVEVGHLNQMM